MLDQETTVEKKKFGIGALMVVTVISILLVIAGIVLVLRMVGKSELYKAVEVEGAEEITLDVGTESDALEENQILYQGKTYALNEDLITILVMGIDKETDHVVGGQSWTKEEESEYGGGQADALFLVVINPHDKNIYIVAINRNAMVDVDVFDENGKYKGIYKKQVALQHGYGNDEEECCLRQVKTVSRMFHGIPINAYASVSMDAIPDLNDAVGGITVEVLDDIIYPEYDMDLHQGETVTLYGEKAYWYVRLRNENVFNSNQLRLARQKQYLSAFALKARDQSMSDIRVAVQLYQTVMKYMCTDIDLTTFTYMATEYLGYNFNIDNMYTLEGEAVQGNVFEEFYLDEEALTDLIVELFYEPVE